MLINIEPKSWQAQLAAFGRRNNLRRTRLEVLGSGKQMESDFWLEDGLLLMGIDMESNEDHGLSVGIMLQASADASDHMTHTVAGVTRLRMQTADGVDEELELEDKEGATTILRFESEEPAKV